MPQRKNTRVTLSITTQVLGSDDEYETYEAEKVRSRKLFVGLQVVLLPHFSTFHPRPPKILSFPVSYHLRLEFESY